MVEVTFTPSADDYVRLQRAMYLRQLRSRRFFTRIAVLVAVVVAAMMAFLIVTGERVEIAALIACGGAIGGLVGVAACVFVNWLFLPRRSRALFAQQRTLHHEHHTIFDAWGMRQHSPRADIALPWDEFPHWHLARDVLLIFSNDLLAYFIPRRAMSDDQLAQTVAILTAAGVPRR